MSDPLVRRSLVVNVPPKAAFETWTQRVDLWWPPSHRQHARSGLTLRFEEGVGGRLVEGNPEDGEVEYGRVTVWEPPDRLDYAFFLGTGPASPTAVSIRFEAIPQGTRVLVEHRPGASGELFARSVGGFERAWTEVLSCFESHSSTGVEP
ncbi:MAG: SRPBCC domain-containing protein [Proteobacteria bacterium]|nr:SRPBCC domain-containing protein [Pseudomonadota bacterium]